MDYYTSSCVSLQSFDQIYTNTIRPKLEAIDLFLKSSEAPFSNKEAASVLGVTLTELLNTMKENDIVELNRLTFFHVIFYLSSDICKLITKQWKYQGYKSYSPQMISDIYKLNLHKVTSAFEEIGTELISDVELMEVFKRIHTTVF